MRQELGVLLRVAQRMGVRPVLGVRAKLSTRHEGHWGSTSGEKAKFGLRPREIVAVVRQLAALGMTDCLQLLHFHIGSQVCCISCVLTNSNRIPSSWQSSLLPCRA
jgi:arginine decarboxylase-like protein